jgi:hypothetical protein
MALELRELGMIELVIPVMISDQYEEAKGSFLRNVFVPEIAVKAVETKLSTYMEANALGTPIVMNRTVASVFNTITSFQGFPIKNCIDKELADAAKQKDRANFDRASLNRAGASLMSVWLQYERKIQFVLKQINLFHTLYTRQLPRGSAT